MRAAVLRDWDVGVRVEQWPDPTPSGDEVVVEVHGAGVCHTDLHLLHWRNRPVPLVMGHEVAGLADGIGPVLVHQSWGCRQCARCAAGEEQLCADVQEAGFERPGGFAERILVPHPRYLLPLGDLDPVRAAPLADAAATTYRAVRRARPWTDRPGARVAVIGIGGLGQFAIQFLLRTTAATVIAYDIDPVRRELAGRLGAHEVHDLAEAPQRGLDAILDIVVEDSTLRLAAASVSAGGLIMRIGSGSGTLPFGRGTLPPEVTLSSARGGSLQDVSAVLDLAWAGLLTWEVEPIALEDLPAGLERLRVGGLTRRLVVTPARRAA